MTARIPSWARTRAAALGALSALALVGACETRMPTSAEIEALDVTRAEAQARELRLLSGSRETVYTIDGRVVTAEEANALPAGSIATVAVTKANADTPRVAITTNAAAVAISRDTPTAGRGMTARGAAVSGGTPIVVIDGVRSDAAALRALNPDEIERVEVFKGDAARRLFPEPQASEGVIRITTKAGARP